MTVVNIIQWANRDLFLALLSVVHSLDRGEHLVEILVMHLTSWVLVCSNDIDAICIV